MITHNWVEGYQFPYPNFSEYGACLRVLGLTVSADTKHKCRKFDKIVEWEKKNQVYPHVQVTYSCVWIQADCLSDQGSGPAGGCSGAADTTDKVGDVRRVAVLALTMCLLRGVIKNYLWMMFSCTV